MAGEWSCYGGGQFSGQSGSCYRGGQFNRGRIMLERWSA